MGLIWFVFESRDSQDTWCSLVVFAAKFVLLISMNVMSVEF